VIEIADAFHSIIGQGQPNGIEIMIDALDECETIRFDPLFGNLRIHMLEQPILSSY